MALATDCNPGHLAATSLLLAMNMAATLFRMTVDECLIGVTRAAAQALGMADRIGTLEAGKQCDLAIWNVERPAELVYRMGFNPLHARVWKGAVNAPAHHEWLAVHHGDAPLIVSFPHTGTEIPAEIESHLVSPWLARKDADYWVDVLYDFAHELGATTIRTALSRTVIDVNRDPSGASLYPGPDHHRPVPARDLRWRAAVQAGQRTRRRRDRSAARASTSIPITRHSPPSCERLRARHGRVVLYDAHSIRSRVPRLFDGELPQFNIGTNNGATCDAGAHRARSRRSARRPRSRSVTNGRFRGGWITRHYGKPANGIHAVQMELAMRGYLHEPEGALDRSQLARTAG